MKREYDQTLVDLIKQRVDIWQRQENRAKVWMNEAREKKKQALRDLRREENRK